MTARLISVVIPTRERNTTLALCLDRLAPGAQTLPHDQYEVIVSDDSAGHLAFELVRDRYPWARWQEGPRRGPAANRNAGARAARGTWLVFTDDDCLPEPTWLEAYVAEMSPNEDALDVLEGRTTCRAGLSSPRQTAPLNLDGGRLWSCNFAIRRAGFEKMGGFDERYPLAHMEDADLQFRLRKSGYMIHFVPAAEVDHPPRPLPWGARLARVHESSVLHMVLHGPRRGLPWYLVNQSRARLSRIVRGRKSIDTLSALASLPVELSSIALNWRAWHRKAQSHTPDTRNSDRRREAPEEGAMMPDPRNSDRRREAPEEGAMMPDTRNSDRRREAPEEGAMMPDPRNSDRRREAPEEGAMTEQRA